MVTRYIHLALGGALLEVGEAVTQRQMVGRSGNGGESTAPHLHFDVQTCGPNLPPGVNNLPCGQTVPVSFRNTTAQSCGLHGPPVEIEPATSRVKTLLSSAYKSGYNRVVYSIQTTEVFEKWFEGLKDRQARARIQARIDRAEDGNFGDCKPVGEGVSEMRFHHGAGFRVYFRMMGAELVVLLAGGVKSTQSSDIKTALKLARRLEA